GGAAAAHEAVAARQAGGRWEGVGPSRRLLHRGARVPEAHGEREAEALARRREALARAGEARRRSAAREASGECRHLAPLPGEPPEESATHARREVVDPLAQVVHPACRVAEGALQAGDA